MTKATLLVRLLKQRLKHNEDFLAQGYTTCSESLKLTYPIAGFGADIVWGHRLAVEEENEFLRAVLEDTK